MNPSAFFSSRVRALAVLAGALILSACAGSPPQDTPQVPTSKGHGLVAVDMDGKSYALDAHYESGQAVALVFWQAWCDSCVAEAPHVEAARRAWSDEVAFYGVVSGPDQSVDEDKLRGLVYQLGLNYPQLRDRDGSWSQRFGVRATPTILVFSAQGELLFQGNHLPEDWRALLDA